MYLGVSGTVIYLFIYLFLNKQASGFHNKHQAKVLVSWLIVTRVKRIKPASGDAAAPQRRDHETSMMEPTKDSLSNERLQ